MAEEYVKISDTEFKVIESVTSVTEIVYSIHDLLRHKEELRQIILDAESKIARIDALISKANELGITTS
jgi:hypothetical protein